MQKCFLLVSTACNYSSVWVAACPCVCVYITSMHVSERETLCLSLYIRACKPLYLSLGASTSTRACLSAHSSLPPPLSVCVCPCGRMSVGVGVCVSASTSVCLREKEFLRLTLRLNGSVRPCADVHVAAWYKNSVRMVILHICVYMCVCVYACFCGMHTYLCSRAHTWRYRQVSAQLWVWKACWTLQVCACISRTMHTDPWTHVLLCVSVCLCVCSGACLWASMSICTPMRKTCRCRNLYMCLCMRLLQLLYPSLRHALWGRACCLCAHACVSANAPVLLHVYVMLHAPLVHLSLCGCRCTCPCTCRCMLLHIKALLLNCSLSLWIYIQYISLQTE